MSDQEDGVPPRSTWAVLVELVKTGRILIGLCAIVLVVAVLVGAYLLIRAYDDQPVIYADDRDHFKYGSTGGERGWKQQFGFGIPYWMWIALPEVFSQYLPDGKAGAGYSAFGMVYEDGKDPRFDLPIGMSMRRVNGVDRVYFTCSVCHTGSVRPAPDAPRQIVLGMPSNTLDFGGVGEFLRQTAHDHRFRSAHMMPAIERIADLRDATVSSPGRYRPTRLGLVDQAVFKLSGVSAMRDQLLTLMGQLRFLDFKSWGPGRVDTFNPPKALLGFPMDRASSHETIGIVDFPSVWNQRARKGMWLHWDGNNCSVDERNLSAGFGTGATPATLDTPNLTRIADWLWTAKPPEFPKDRINAALAAQGAPIYRQYCHRCHGTPAAPFRDAEVHSARPGDAHRRDRHRSRAARLLHARARTRPEPALRRHTGQHQRRGVPRLRRGHLQTGGRRRGVPRAAREMLSGEVLALPQDAGLLEPAARRPLAARAVSPQRIGADGGGPPRAERRRPAVFFIGYDVYDFANLGFVTSGPDAERRGWRYDTSRPGNGNKGHEGAAYGTTLSPELRRALLEYLKTF